MASATSGLSSKLQGITTPRPVLLDDTDTCMNNLPNVITYRDSNSRPFASRVQRSKTTYDSLKTCYGLVSVSLPACSFVYYIHQSTRKINTISQEKHDLKKNIKQLRGLNGLLSRRIPCSRESTRQPLWGKLAMNNAGEYFQDFQSLTKHKQTQGRATYV